MTYLVPFDGSDLAVAALERATEFASAMDEPVVGGRCGAARSRPGGPRDRVTEPQ